LFISAIDRVKSHFCFFAEFTAAEVRSHHSKLHPTRILKAGMEISPTKARNYLLLPDDLTITLNDTVNEY